MVLLYFFLYLVVVLVINYVVARKFEDIAIQKGYKESATSFHMCLWLGIIGCLYVIALPDKSTKKETPEETIETPKIEEPQEKSIYKNTAFYKCDQITVGENETEGRCVICQSYSHHLRNSKIKNSLGKRDINICERCVQLFKDNCEK